MKTISSAPGKLVLSGEYAVLANAPAVVIAMNRRGTAEIQATDSDKCNFTSTGFNGAACHKLSRLLTNDPVQEKDPAYLAWHVINQLKKRNLLEDSLTGFDVKTDSSTLFSSGKKLGLGSSAAICTSLTAGFMSALCNATQLKHTTEDIFDIALSAHRASQNARGSGLDIATATFGGMLGFQLISGKPVSSRLQMPENMHYQVINSGQPSSTRKYLDSFSKWQNSADTSSLDGLCKAASNFSDTMANTPASWFGAMADYITALQHFDRAAQQDIYTKAHTLLGSLALEHRILYKPCGAGGGDLGIALSEHSRAITAFSQAVKAAGFQSIDLEIDINGVHTTIV